MLFYHVLLSLFRKHIGPLTNLHHILFWAVFSSSLHPMPVFLVSASSWRLHVFLGLFPCGFQVKAWQHGVKANKKCTNLINDWASFRQFTFWVGAINYLTPEKNLKTYLRKEAKGTGGRAFVFFQEAPSFSGGEAQPRSLFFVVVVVANFSSIDQ